MTIPEHIDEAMRTDDVATYKQFMLTHPEALRGKSGRCIDFYLAAQNGSLEVVKFLVSAGVDVNEVADEYTGETAIYNAACNNHIKVVRWLLDQGAQINEHLRGKKWCSTLTAAARKGYLDIVRLLLERGADINAPGPGMTALDYAVAFSQAQVADYLRLKGAKTAAELGIQPPQQQAPARAATKASGAGKKSAGKKNGAKKKKGK